MTMVISLQLLTVAGATAAYLAQIPPAATRRSDAYFEGGYWLILWEFLAGAAISLLLLTRRWSAGMRRVAERVTRFPFLQTLVYWGQYLVATTVLGFPLAAYVGFFREHQYGLATQTFGAWALDEAKGLLVGILLGGLAVGLLFAIVRRLTRTWWLWGAVASMGILMVAILIGPVFRQPLFNTPRPLKDARITAPVLSLARANGISAQDSFEIDASKQTTRISANVSGFANTLRITLNDNLLGRGGPKEIQAVMAQEIGPSVLNHRPKLRLFLLIVGVGRFAFLRGTLAWALARWGEAWPIRGLGDPAILPRVVLAASLWFFARTPVRNTFIRAQAHAADRFGVAASREPDGFARAAIHLSEYRKICPTPLEEFRFCEHPSGGNRLHRAMPWKAANQQLSPAWPWVACGPGGWGNLLPCT